MCFVNVHFLLTSSSLVLMLLLYSFESGGRYLLCTHESARTNVLIVTNANHCYLT